MTLEDDLGDFLREAARRRQARRQMPDAEATRRRVRGEIEYVEPAVPDAESAQRKSLSDQHQQGRSSLAETEAARYAAREKHVERGGFAEQAQARTTFAPPARPAGAATPGAPSPSARSGRVSLSDASPIDYQGQTASAASNSPVEDDIAAVRRLLASGPAGLRQAFLLTEILRPKYIDGVDGSGK